MTSETKDLLHEEGELFSQLLQASKLSLNQAYSPYSGFKVASSLIVDTGEVFSGCNIENASYGATVCAERVAIWKAVSEGHKSIRALLVLTNSEDPWPPCGLCRQVMSEFMQKNTTVWVANFNNVSKKFRLEELCPSFFTAEQLKPAKMPCKDD